MLPFFSVSGKKPPPAPGCVDQQLTSLSVAGPSTKHVELEIPPAPNDTPYALQILLDLYRDQMMAMIDTMKNPDYKDVVNGQIAQEKVTYTYIYITDFFVF